MKKKYTLAILLICLISQPLLYGQTKPGTSQIPTGHQLYKSLKIQAKKNNSNKVNRVIPSQIRDKAVDRMYYEFDRTCDPRTGKVPQDIYQKEQLFTKQSKSLSSVGNIKKSSTSWKNRGPFNVGGRTRALAIDKTNENIILAGGVSGGLWRSEDGGKNWKRVTRRFQNPSITSIVQDPRPGYQHIWYYGGGERIGNSATAVALYTGAGIYKSQDGGRTWELLEATADNTILTASPFDVVNSMAVHPQNGDLYVATFNGVHRSQDGGKSFQEVFASGFDKGTEIMITPKGTLYATIPEPSIRSNENGGVYRSKNGVDWTLISEGIFDLDRSTRMICAYNPSDENEVYILSTLVTPVATSTNLFRYNAIDDTITDFTDQLPITIEPVGGLNTQFAYNMVLAVHPTNPDMIFFGGTNLFRTTDGFRTAVNNFSNNWIAGYSPNNDVSLYPNNHPDIHAIVFFPSNPNKVLMANDGGVFVTEDITTNNSFEEPVSWTSLNNGYITTQPYSISLNPELESDELLAGFQDNGTWFTNQKDSKASWVEQFAGDGSYSAFADKGRTRYVSSQLGDIFRLNMDNNNEVESIAYVTPAIANPDNFSFINPFLLDPNDDNIMYLPVGTSLFRNTNLDDIPAVASIDELTSLATVNWSEIASIESIAIDNRERNNITALDVSKFPEADKVYFGTGQGQVYRMDFASLSSSKPVDIFTGKGFPEDAFVNSVQVDPNNSDRVVIAFSNYNVKSVFYTTDAGETWTDISGNLEENKDGTGNGPSVRWVSFLGNNNGLLAGTSTGLYYTNRIVDENTVWQLENNQIGDGVVMQVRTRKDGLTALAVHGNGVYSKKFNVAPQQGEITLLVNKKPEDISFSIEDTPESITVDLSEVFRDTNGEKLTLRVESSDTNNEFIDYKLSGKKLQIFFTRTNSAIENIDKIGEAVIRIIAASGAQKVATEFNVQVFQTPLFDTFDPNRSILPTIFNPSEVPLNINTLEENILQELADQFIIPEGETWTIERMKMIVFSDLIFLELSVPGDQGRFRIYKDDNGKPGKEIINITDTIKTNPDFDDTETSKELEFELPEATKLTSGKYWCSFVRIEQINSINNLVYSYHLIEPNEPNFNKQSDFYGRGTNVRTLLPEWNSYSDLRLLDLSVGQEGKATLIFSLFGEKESTASKKSLNLTENDVVAYPNPTTGLVDLQFATLPEETITIKVMDISGKEVVSQTFKSTQNSYTIDTSDWVSGMYIARVNGNTTKMTTKIIRK
ncbi:T9SS type A sorting domain-containing protein [Aquimarina sp. ERC-38]|uniref:T9SS type A sorting domain-containing protein n=1 Tax=Aquimarina sp. ERC-38 TaxID=2949996 RepID=UPI00224815C8|nr:T9SS type A sorting domain-containing protein [Aquimarina sp. ERC-38]UZO79139.1 T9SS type A sorting domain-containing protein [Aquimarina sp. ERC-38]